MSLSTLLRRSAAFMSVRLVGKSCKHHAPAFSAAILRRSISMVAEKSPPGLDLKLKRKLEAEIECDADPDVVKIPAGFSFKIEEKSGDHVVRLTRQYEGETIEVEVYMPDLISDDVTVGDSEDSPQSTLPLLVKVVKDGGHYLAFSCNANADEVNIVGISVKEPESPDDMASEGPDFSVLDEGLQKIFQEYLIDRGITPSATLFLHEYMINKDIKEYKMWLRSVKKFVEA